VLEVVSSGCAGRSSSVSTFLGLTSLTFILSLLLFLALFARQIPRVGLPKANQTIERRQS